MYKELKKIQILLFKSDDRMEQDDLFELQEYVSELTLKVAKKEGKTDDLIKSFNWLYKRVEVK
ncbi:MAG: hypothetical protein WC677_02580 [Clostridia bacterium]